jgi:predicted nucleic acid-binding protein
MFFSIGWERNNIFFKNIKIDFTSNIYKKINSIEVFMSFTTLTAEVQELTYEDKFELKNLLEKYLVDERRAQIKEDSQKALEMAKNEELIFSDDIDFLLRSLD